MPDRIKLLLFLVLLAIALVTGMLARHYTQPAPPAPTQAELPEHRPDFSMRDLDGHTRHISEWDGHVVLINFWATWCPPCRDEIPLLMEAQEKLGEQGLQVIGVAIDDPAKVAGFAAELQINYPLLAHRTAGIDIARDFGDRVGALPFSALYDTDGRVLAAHTGELHREDLYELLALAFDEIPQNSETE